MLNFRLGKFFLLLLPLVLLYLFKTGPQSTRLRGGVGTWSARSPVCPLILAYENSILLPFAKTVCVSVRKNSVDVSEVRK